MTVVEKEREELKCEPPGLHHKFCHISKDGYPPYYCGAMYSGKPQHSRVTPGQTHCRVCGKPICPDCNKIMFDWL